MSKYLGGLVGINIVSMITVYLLCDLSVSNYILFCCLLVLYSSFCTCRTYHSWNINLQNNEIKSFVSSKLKENKFYKISDFPIYCTNNSLEYASLILGYLDNINENQKQKFIEKGFVIIVEDYSNLEKWGFTKKVGDGLFDCSRKMILLSQSPAITFFSNISRTPEVLFKKAFYHEWGHFVDYMYGLISETPKVILSYKNKKKDFKSVKKKSKFLKPYELTNAAEYFAEHYSKYKTVINFNSAFPRYRSFVDLTDIFDNIESIK